MTRNEFVFSCHICKMHVMLAHDICTVATVVIAIDGDRIHGSSALNAWGRAHSL